MRSLSHHDAMSVICILVKLLGGRVVIPTWRNGSKVQLDIAIAPPLFILIRCSGPSEAEHRAGTYSPLIPSMN